MDGSWVVTCGHKCMAQVHGSWGQGRVEMRPHISISAHLRATYWPSIRLHLRMTKCATHWPRFLERLLLATLFARSCLLKLTPLAWVVHYFNCTYLFRGHYCRLAYKFRSNSDIQDSSPLMSIHCLEFLVVCPIFQPFCANVKTRLCNALELGQMPLRCSMMTAG